MLGPKKDKGKMGPVVTVVVDQIQSGIRSVALPLATRGTATVRHCCGTSAALSHSPERWELTTVK